MAMAKGKNHKLISIKLTAHFAFAQFKRIYVPLHTYT